MSRQASPNARLTAVKSLPMLALLVLGSSLAAPGEALAQDYAAGPIRISRPWAPPSAGNAKDAPGYLTMINTGSVPDRLVSGSFIEASHVELHTAGGRRGKGMTAVESLVLNPGETVTLKPGGDHLMFTGLKGPLRAGMRVQSILRFERSGTVLLEFAVEGRPAKPASARRGETARGDAAKAGEKAGEKGAEAPAGRSAAAQGR